MLQHKLHLSPSIIYYHCGKAYCKLVNYWNSAGYLLRNQLGRISPIKI